MHLENLLVVRLILQAPNLQCFKYEEHTDRPCKIDILDGYNTLQTLELVGASITGQHFQDIFCKFPNISELELESCYKLNHIEIQSEKLKKFTLVGFSCSCKWGLICVIFAPASAIIVLSWMK